jgi:VIT1/CCC1 family predicted Fe2+/Mn2+ transporter
LRHAALSVYADGRRDVIVMEHDHTREAIRKRLASGPRVSYLRDWIYGGIDGAVTTFAVVAGVVGAEFSPVVILVLGFANLLADGFSMAASNFSGTRAEVEDLRRMREIEQRHIAEEPDGEREEVRQIYRRKGFEGDDLEKVVSVLTADRQRWIQTMLTEEYGLPLDVRSPWLAAANTFSAFIVCGAIPIIPFIAKTPSAFAVSAALTGLVFFTIGAVKSRWSPSSWLRSGVETFVVGAVAAGLAYAIGHLLRNVTFG